MAIINITVEDRQTLLDIAIQYLGDSTGAIALAKLNNISITEILMPGRVLIVDTDQMINAKVVNYLLQKDIIPITE